MIDPTRFLKLCRTLIMASVLLLALTGCADDGQKKSTSSHAGVAKDSLELRYEKLTAQMEGSDNAQLRFERAKLAYDQGLLEEALSDLTKCIELDAEKQPCYRLLSTWYLDNNDVRLATQALEDALEVNPEDTATLLQMAELQIIIEKFAAAHITLNKLIRLNPDLDEVYLLKGIAFRDQGKMDEAVGQLQKVIQLNPDLVDAHLILGQIFENAGNPAALRYYQNALRLRPDDRQVKLALAGYSWSKGDVDAALNQYTAMIASHPEFTEAYYNRGLLRLELSDAVGASEDFLKAVSIQPDFIYGNYYLGVSLEEQGNLEGAYRALERASRLTPKDEKIQSKFKDIRDELGK